MDSEGIHSTSVDLIETTQQIGKDIADQKKLIFLVTEHGKYTENNGARLKTARGNAHNSNDEDSWAEYANAVKAVSGNSQEQRMINSFAGRGQRRQNS